MTLAAAVPAAALLLPPLPRAAGQGVPRRGLWCGEEEARLGPVAYTPCSAIVLTKASLVVDDDDEKEEEDEEEDEGRRFGSMSSRLTVPMAWSLSRARRAASRPAAAVRATALGDTSRCSGGASTAARRNHGSVGIWPGADGLVLLAPLLIRFLGMASLQHRYGTQVFKFYYLQCVANLRCESHDAVGRISLVCG